MTLLKEGLCYLSGEYSVQNAMGCRCVLCITTCGGEVPISIPRVPRDIRMAPSAGGFSGGGGGVGEPLFWVKSARLRVYVVFVRYDLEG